ncbi:MAG: hypothetical protein H7Y11_07350 [Armatimonadetes bacterium]|nr:hypothetical protein [Anaerolineae bacterium]
MTTYQEAAKPLQIVLLTSLPMGMTAEALAALTDLAVLMVTHGKTTEAANTLAYVMRHPDVPYETFDRAEDLFIDLEAQLCPRVISDAQALASSLTLRGALEAALAVE